MLTATTTPRDYRPLTPREYGAATDRLRALSSQLVASRIEDVTRLRAERERLWAEDEALTRSVATARDRLALARAELEDLKAERDGVLKYTNTTARRLREYRARLMDLLKAEKELTPAVEPLIAMTYLRPPRKGQKHSKHQKAI